MKQNIVVKKELVNQAFKELRKRGYFARQNFWCCQSCASAAIPEGHADKAVYYHAQDANDLKDSGEFYIAWSGNGKEIAAIFQDVGLKVNWNGSDSQRIQIIAH